MTGSFVALEIAHHTVNQSINLDYVLMKIIHDEELRLVGVSKPSMLDNNQKISQ